MNGSKDINVNIRLISSTSKNLGDLVKENKFREDLYHRLNVMPIDLPSLSSRTEDMPLLIDYFKTKLSEINGVQEPEIDINNDSLYTYNWPGNVRELENIVQRALVLCTEKEICSTDIVIDNNPLNVSTNSLLDENTQQLAI